MRRFPFASVVPVAILACAAASAQSRPKVIRAEPDNGAVDVDPGLKEIVVEFDQDMQRGSHSWVGGGESFPTLRGKPIWRSARIAVLPVKLEPGHRYALSINSNTFTNFVSKKGAPAEPYPIEFETAGGEPRQKLTPEENRTALKELREAIERYYSYRDLRGVDWDKQFAKYAEKLEQAETPAKFAREAGKLLAAAKDLHIWLTVDDQQYASHRRSVRRNFNRAVVKRRVSGWKERSDNVATGTLDDGVAYVLIASWGSANAGDVAALDEALDGLRDVKALVIDVRPNGGGDESWAQRVAGRFVEKPVIYAGHVTRAPDAPGGFGDRVHRVLEPAPADKRLRCRVAVLMGTANMSSCEAFLLMMKQVPGCKLIGERSYGSSGNPRPHALANGVTVFLPSWKSMTPGGEFFEGTGIAPDIEVEMTTRDYASKDPVLDAALEQLE